MSDGRHDELEGEQYSAPFFDSMIIVLEEIANHANADPDDRPNRVIGNVRMYQSPDGAHRLVLDDLDSGLGVVFNEMKARENG